MQTADLFILVGYFVVVFGIGAYFFRRAKTSRSYFLADRSVGWVAIGASLFASNISSEHFIGLAGSGASSGLAVGHFEWLAVFMCMTLAWVFVPFYLRSNVYTMPEFLERRYGPACRWYLTTKGRMPVSEFLPYTWYNTPNIHFCTFEDFERLCREQRAQVLDRLAVDRLHRHGWASKLWPNLLGEIGIYRVSAPRLQEHRVAI